MCCALTTAQPRSNRAQVTGQWYCGLVARSCNPASLMMTSNGVPCLLPTPPPYADDQVATAAITIPQGPWRLRQTGVAYCLAANSATNPTSIKYLPCGSGAQYTVFLDSTNLPQPYPLGLLVLMKVVTKNTNKCISTKPSTFPFATVELTVVTCNTVDATMRWLVTFAPDSTNTVRKVYLWQTGGMLGTVGRTADAARRMPDATVWQLQWNA